MTNNNMERNMFRGEEYPSNYSFKREYRKGEEPEELTVVGAVTIVLREQSMLHHLVWVQGDVTSMSAEKLAEKNQKKTEGTYEFGDVLVLSPEDQKPTRKKRKKNRQSVEQTTRRQRKQKEKRGRFSR